MKRVVILGSPGSGKSTFAQKLHNETKLPLVHLDFYYHQTEFNYYNDSSAWVDKVEQLMKPKEWIIDGNYQSTIPRRSEVADTIILFNISRWVCLYRVLKRRINYRNKERLDMPSEWREKANWYFIKYLLTFPERQLPDILKELKKYPNKQVLIFKNQKESEQYLRNQSRDNQ
jgi:adenylate kinase family enzyme